MLSASEKLAQALHCLYSVRPTEDTRIVLGFLYWIVFEHFSFPRVSTYGSDMQSDECCLMIYCVSDDVQ